jgi:DNA-binding HxlR family transcriptional regulator
VNKRRGYGQFCPLSKAAEILAERWTPLVIRELIFGSQHFAQFQRGIPLISPTMLSKRLQELESADIIERRRGPEGWAYHLTPAGKDLAPVIQQLAVWGRRWALQKLRREDLEPGYLIWAMHRRLNTEALGPAQVVIAFHLLDAPANHRHFWLVVNDGQVEICLNQPGKAVDVTLTARLRPLAEVWLGQQQPQAAVRTGSIRLEGRATLVRSFPRWCPRSMTAPVSTARRRTSSPVGGRRPPPL